MEQDRLVGRGNLHRRGGGAPRQRGGLQRNVGRRQRTIISNKVRAIIVDHVVNRGFTMAEAARFDLQLQTFSTFSDGRVSINYSISKNEAQTGSLVDVLLFHQKRIYGEEVEMKVRPGDNITLYCDRSLTLGSVIVWIRNCSHENQPSLIIDFKQGFKWSMEVFQRFSSVHNRYNNSYDLHITNISVFDLGLYYCAKLETKVNKDEKGIISGSKVYYYGNQMTRLSLKDAATDQKDKLNGRNTAECADEEVCYASLDVITKRQKQRKTKRVQSSDFSTYAQKRIYGEEVQMKVRTGDNITLYCDRSLTDPTIVWIRNCSHENQPSLLIDFRKLDLDIFQRFSFIHNPYDNSYDLQITNISVSDLGLYYCAEVENKINKDENGIISSSEVFYYGNRTTRLSLEVILFYQKIIYGEEMEMKVRPGDNITLYCDRSLTVGSVIVWIRNCSHENQPSLIIDFTKWDLEIPRFSSIHNNYSNSYDLQITNISISDLGLYYCAELERKVNKDEKGILSRSEVYYYGTRTTRLSLKGSAEILTEDFIKGDTKEKHQCEMNAATDQKDKLNGRNTAECADEEVCYASLDVITKRQKQFLLFCQKRIYGEEVEMKVRTGDNITLYCNRSLTVGSNIIWIRNCSHENQPSLIIEFRKLDLDIFQRFSFIHNSYDNSYDLQITNISASDLGLYYCAEVENKVNKDEKGIISSSEVYYYGNRTTRLSLEDSTTDQKHKLKCRNVEENDDSEVCYASVDVMTRRQKWHRETRVQSTDFTTYAPVRTETE
ncbi:hypothetical protein ROHU_026167 [Labeo rohita]|uniref:Ig-like domain-containing protein n=1 Tax=Labeo rohita TaxID=84645 RepID=A0A498MEH8_LABRO|nr:hypothetical protein ROHU_026167 [Labeo rohita]